MWDVSGPFVSAWIRDELGPEAALADGLREQGKTLALIPDIIRRLDAQLSKKGDASPAPPLPDLPLMWAKGEKRRGWRYALSALSGTEEGHGLFGWLGRTPHSGTLGYRTAPGKGACAGK